MRNLKQNPLRLGILGCGSFMQRRILPALQEVDTIKLVCLQKRDLEEARKVAQGYHVPFAVATRKDLLNHPEVEAVFIGTPNNLHEEDSIACAEAKKPTLCEKPLAPTVDAIKRMMQSFKEHGVPLYVGHSLRFKPSLHIARQMLREGDLGDLLNLRAYLSIPLSDNNWRFHGELAGGVLQDIGVHLIDTIRFISGCEIESIYASANASWNPNSTEVDKTVIGVCRLSQGSLASFEGSFQQPFLSGFEVVGSKSRLVSCNSLRQTMDPIETLCHIQEDDSRHYFPLKASNVYVEELKHFADIVAGIAAPLIPADVGLQNQRVIEAAYRSLANKKEMPITP